MKDAMVHRLLRSNLRLQQLNMFILLERHGSVHRVAELIGLTQPAVSKSLKEIEALVGAPLFFRESRGLRSTSICQPLVRAAREAIQGLGSALASIKEMQSGSGGHVSIGVVGSHALKTISGSISTLQRDHPHLRIQVSTADWSGHFSELADGKLDMVIGPMPTMLPQNERFKIEPLQIEHKLMEIVTRSGRSSSAGPMKFADAVRRCVWILPPAQDPIRMRVDAAFTECGIDGPGQVVEAMQPELMLIHLDSDDVAAVVEAPVAATLAEKQMVSIIEHPMHLAMLIPLVLLQRAHDHPTVASRVLVHELLSATTS